jgi:D-3-phosphoglycerate dehydrogenase
VFDFDSTLVTIETLDTLIKRSLTGPDGGRKRRLIDGITLKAMNGEMDFNESITTRLRISEVRAEHFAAMASEIAEFITPGIEDVVDLLRRSDAALFIVSGGFDEIIAPVADRLGVPLENCFANRYIADADGNVTGLCDGPLTREGGKTEVVKAIRGKTDGPVVMLGDGMSDYRVFADGAADFFVGCGFSAVRPNVLASCGVKRDRSAFVRTTVELLELLHADWC